jgi:hypothetical protein
MEARPPAENRHGGAPGRRARPAGRAPRLTSAAVAPDSATNEILRRLGAPPAPHGADATEEARTRTQERVAGTKKTGLCDMWRRGDVEMTMRQQARRRAASAAC